LINFDLHVVSLSKKSHSFFVLSETKNSHARVL
jgi:hypothetical protein